jgi:para-nitrobenzyl esterase
LQFAADTDQRCGSFQQAVWHADARNVVYQYQFDRTIPGRPRPQHSGEVPYVFGNLLKDGFLGGPYGEADRKISGDIQGYWTNFAKTGNPNGTGLPAWPRFESGARPYLEFTDNGPVAKANLRREICDLFSSNLLAQMRGTK